MIALKKRTCPSCSKAKPASEFGDWAGSRPCKACERERVVSSRWKRISLIKLRQEIEIEEKRLEQKKAVLAERVGEACRRNSK